MSTGKQWLALLGLHILVAAVVWALFTLLPAVKL